MGREHLLPVGWTKRGTHSGNQFVSARSRTSCTLGDPVQHGVLEVEVRWKPGSLRGIDDVSERSVPLSVSHPLRPWCI